MSLLEGKRCAVVMLGNLDQFAGDLASMATSAGMPAGVPLISCCPQRLVTQGEDGAPAVQQPYTHDRLWQKWNKTELVPMKTVSVRKADKRGDEGPGESSQGQGQEKGGEEKENKEEEMEEEKKEEEMEEEMEEEKKEEEEEMEEEKKKEEEEKKEEEKKTDA